MKNNIKQLNSAGSSSVLVNGVKNLVFTGFIVIIIALMPSFASADNVGYTHYHPYVSNYGNQNSYNSHNNYENRSNPVPILYHSTPNSVTEITGNMAIMLNGANFVPGIVAKFDNSNRATIYENSNQVTVILTYSDLTKQGDHIITVANPSLGGGNSNGITFTVKNSPMVVRTQTQTIVHKHVYENRKETEVAEKNTEDKDNESLFSKILSRLDKLEESQLNTTAYLNSITSNKVAVSAKKNNKDLSASAADSVSGNLSLGLIQWLIIAIMILVIVILMRKLIFVGNEHAPLKHE
jgi:hypothetical protein